MELIPEWAPSLHPMVVHFPIAILSIAILFDLVSLFLPDDQEWWSEKSTTVLYLVGAISAVAVYYTGQSAADSVFLEAEAQTVLNTHADLAWWTVWFYGIYALLRLGASWRAPAEYRKIVHIIFFIVSLGGFYLLYQTGDNGAKMVFRHGVGVQKAEEPEEMTAGSARGVPGETGFNREENGDWTWEILQGAVSVLREEFHFLSGSLESLGPENVEAGETHLLRFSGDDLNAFFVTHDRWKNVQVDYRIDLSDFNGTVTLANHVQNQTRYDYVSITGGGTVIQGRMTADGPEVFEEGAIETGGILFIRVVSNGTHFRGYVDEQMVVHGHGDAPESGAVGLKLEGSGTVLLERMEMVQLTPEE